MAATPSPRDRSRHPGAARAWAIWWVLLFALWRRVRRRGERGAMAEVPYAAVADDPDAAAHRVFTQALGSLAPNTIVVDVDRERRRLLVHELVPTGDPAAAAEPLPDEPS